MHTDTFGARKGPSGVQPGVSQGREGSRTKTWNRDLGRTHRIGRARRDPQVTGGRTAGVWWRVGRRRPRRCSTPRGRSAMPSVGASSVRPSAPVSGSDLEVAPHGSSSSHGPVGVYSTSGHCQSYSTTFDSVSLESPQVALPRLPEATYPRVCRYGTSLTDGRSWSQSWSTPPSWTLHRCLDPRP